MARPKEVVVLVCTEEIVRLVITAAAIEVHSIDLDRARAYFQEQGFVRGNGEDITFPTTIPPQAEIRGATRLEVWVKY